MELAPNLDKGSVGAVETLRKDRGDIEGDGRISGEQRRRVGNVKFTLLQGPDVRRMRLIQENGESPNTEPGAETLAICTPSLTTSTAPLLRTSSLPVVEPAVSTVSPVWHVTATGLRASPQRPRRPELVWACSGPPFGSSKWETAPARATF